MGKSFEDIKQKVLSVIKQSSVPEDFEHSTNTLKWVMHLYPEADLPLQIAALAHDIDRADACLKVQSGNFDNYDAFKNAHAKRSSEILNKILEELGIEISVSRNACRLVEKHEFGGDKLSDILKTADSISFFDINLPHYFKREGLEETRKRCEWGLNRLDSDALEIVSKLRYEDQALNQLMGESIAGFPKARL